MTESKKVSIRPLWWKSSTSSHAVPVRKAWSAGRLLILMLRKSISSLLNETAHEAKTGALFIAAYPQRGRTGGGGRMKSMPLRNLPPFSDLPSKLRMISSTWKGDSKIMGKMAGMDEKMHKSHPTSVFLPWKEPKPWPLIPKRKQNLPWNLLAKGRNRSLRLHGICTIARNRSL